MGPRGRFYPYLYYCDYIGLLGTGFMQALQLGRAPRAKETLPNFLKWSRVTRYPLVFRELTGGQRTPGKMGRHISYTKLELISYKLRGTIKVIKLYHITQLYYRTQTRDN